MPQQQQSPQNAKISKYCILTVSNLQENMMSSQSVSKPCVNFQCKVGYSIHKSLTQMCFELKWDRIMDKQMNELSKHIFLQTI